MRALMVASASRVTVIVPASAWVTNSFTRSVPRWRAAVSRVNRPSSIIWSSSACSFTCSLFAAAAAALASLIGASLGPFQFVAELVELVGIVDRVHQQLVQLVVALQAAAQVGQLGAQFEQFAQRLHLACDLLGREVVQTLEVQVDFDLSRIGIVAELVFHRIAEVGIHAGEDSVEVGGRDFD